MDNNFLLSYLNELNKLLGLPLPGEKRRELEETVMSVSKIINARIGLK